MNYLLSLPGCINGLQARTLDIVNLVLTCAPRVAIFDNVTVLYNSLFSVNLATVSAAHSPSTGNSYSVAGADVKGAEEWASSSLIEGAEDQRFMRFMNPVFKYDFKVGNYMPDDTKKLNPHMFMTIKDVTTGIRKSS